MGRVLLNMQYLLYERDVDKHQEIDEQLMEKLYSIYIEIELGYYDPRQKAQLETNTRHIKNVLCFIQKHWKVLMRADFPTIPDADSEDFVSSEVVCALVKITRKKENK